MIPMENLFLQIRDFLNIGWDIGNYTLTVEMLFYTFLVLLIGYLINRFLRSWLLNFIKDKDYVNSGGQRRIFKITRNLLILGTIIGCLKTLNLDFVLYELVINERFLNFRVSTIFMAIMVFLVAQFFDWIIARILINQYFEQRDKNPMVVNKLREPKDEKSIANKTIQYVVYAFAIILILNSFNIDFDFYTFQDGGHLSLLGILQAVFTILVARLIIWVFINIILYNYYKSSEVDIGSQFAINKLLAYAIYVFAVLFALQNNLHFNLNIILGGAAALMVGIGLGLQQTFNDLISGIILLFERTVEVGDVVEVGGMIGTITQIGIRTSVVQVRDNTSVVVPNSKFITENVINWSHNDDKVRFKLLIGVAYGSDTQKVKDLLLEAANNHKSVIKRPAPTIRFVDFADSSLNFELHFWSKQYIAIEDVKSDLRFAIDALFREHEIEIPFPQRDIWHRS